jgi:hypothetical protein
VTIGTIGAVVILAALSYKTTGGGFLAYAPPSYIKDTVAYKEGSDGLVVYLILADADGQMTRANGSTTLNIYNPNNRLAYSFSANVTTSEFTDTTLGQGAFAHSGTILSFGRIVYSQLTYKPASTLDDYKVNVIFTAASGKVLTGNTTVFLSP